MKANQLDLWSIVFLLSNKALDLHEPTYKPTGTA